MEPTRKTSVALPGDLHESLLRAAEERGVTVEELILSAVRSRYRTRASVTDYPRLDQMPPSEWKFPTFDEPHW